MDGRASGYLDRLCAEDVLGREWDIITGSNEGEGACFCRTEARRTSGGDEGDEACSGESTGRSPWSESVALFVDIDRRRFARLGRRAFRASASAALTLPVQEGLAFPVQPLRMPFDWPMLPAADA